MPIPPRMVRTSQRRPSSSSGASCVNVTTASSMSVSPARRKSRGQSRSIRSGPSRSTSAARAASCRRAHVPPATIGSSCGEHARMPAELDHDQRPALPQKAAEAPERRHRIGDVVHDHRRPDDVGGRQLRERRARDRPRLPRRGCRGRQRAPGAAAARGASAAESTPGDSGRRKALREGACDDSRPAADVHDVGHRLRIEPCLLKPGRDGLDQRQHERSVDLECVSHRVPIEVGAAVVMVAVPALVRAVGGHEHSTSPFRARAAASATGTMLDFGVSSA